MNVSGIGQAYEITKVINDYEAIYSITKSFAEPKEQLGFGTFCNLLSYEGQEKLY